MSQILQTIQDAVQQMILIVLLEVLIDVMGGMFARC